MKELRGNEKWAEIIKHFPQAGEIWLDLGIVAEELDAEKALVELARENKIPLQVLLNNLAKKLGLTVKWPEIEGLGADYKDDFGKSSRLRQGKPSGIGKIIAVHSGKGGVGKTTIAIALAIHLSRLGKKVGLLDLDIDCPNITRALALESRHIASLNKKIIPLDFQGIKVISMGAIQARANQAIMWRGPILAKAIEQLFFDADWGELDVLIVDFPPGTSEAPLTFFNMIKPDGAVIISTPQETALDDASKSVDMCNSLGVKVLGVVENMCGEIFGNSNTQKTEEITGAKWIGKIELEKKIAQGRLWLKDLSEDLVEVLEKLEKLIF
jgi:ATP-binding protein involved in chromosome partitioning